jgi:hypothetical protein
VEPTTLDLEQQQQPEKFDRPRSRVNWGENQFHHFDVPTPEAHHREEREMSQGDARGKDKDERGEYQEKLDRVIAGDMEEAEMRHFNDKDDERYI